METDGFDTGSRESRKIGEYLEEASPMAGEFTAYPYECAQALAVDGSASSETDHDVHIPVAGFYRPGCECQLHTND